MKRTSLPLLRRRAFITLLSATAVWPLAANAQQAAMPVVGYLGASTPAADSQRVAAFVQRLRELGWIEGRTVAIEYRWSEGRTERYLEIAAEFVRLNVGVIVATGGAIPAAKQARLPGSGRSGWRWLCCDPGTTRGQCYRLVSQLGQEQTTNKECPTMRI